MVVARAFLLASVLCTLPIAAALAADARAADADPVDALPADAMGERLAACASCHGDRGQGLAGAEYVPHLSGKPAGYLADQLQAFRDGRRHYGQMVWLVRNMDDAWIAQIAAFYAGMPPLTQPQQPTPQLEPELAARAERLVRQGDAGAAIPACSACHGEALTGLEPGIPALVGLPADYIVAQLGAWRTGVRHAREPDCMRRIARALDARDLRLLGEWLSAQGHAQPRAPAPAGSFVPPLACGPLPSTQEAQ